MNIPTYDDVLRLLRSGTTANQKSFVQGLPENGFKAVALALIESGNPEMVLMALGPMTQQYCYGSKPAIGEPLAAALHERAEELFRTHGHGLLPTTLSGLANSHLKALSLLGKYRELLTWADHYIPIYQQLPEPQNLPSLQTLQIEALVMLQRFDDAEHLLKAQTALFNHPINGIEIRRLDGLVKAAKARVENLHSTQQPPPLDSSSMLQIMTNFVSADPDLAQNEQLLKALTGFKGPSLDPKNAEDFATLGETLDDGEQFLTKGERNSELAVAGNIRRASGIFVHDPNPPRDRILASLKNLQSSLDWATKHGVSQLINDAYWGLYLCHSRLKDSSRAADALIELRNGLEDRRKGIKNPFERAGIFAQYRDLFPALCEHLWKAGRAGQLLEAIESSKGRAIADRLTQQKSEIVPDSRIYASVAALPRLTRKFHFHYISYFLDERCIYAVLVDKYGTVHMSPAIPLLETAVRKAAWEVAPEEWHQRRGLGSNPNTSEELAPAVAWLSDLLDQRVLDRADHIVFCPDDILYNVPFHYLKFRDGILLNWFSTSKVHSAFQIERVLQDSPADALAQYTGVAVLAVEDQEGSRSKEAERAFFAPLDFLRSCFPNGKDLVGTKATIDAIASERLTNRIIHFSTHGWFAKKNPYRHSYLLVATPSGLPTKVSLQAQFDAPAAHSPDFPVEKANGALTARFIVERLDFRDSHVSTMACLAGLAREGAGGDALGLDWAFLQAGAASLLSTHWEIGWEYSAPVLKVFYKKWLTDKRGRAAAIRETMLELLNGNSSPQSLQKWAGFSLTGDFR